MNSDIYCLVETHLKTEDNIECQGYTSFHFHRHSIHRNAPKASGGVAVLVRDLLLTDFKVRIIDKEIDGILGIEFVNKHSDFSFVIYCCYLSPDNSVWGRDPTSFFSHLITQLYVTQDHDLVFLCGDLNGRVGKMHDTVNEIDNVCQRKVLDTVKGGHGEAIIDFVKDSNLAIVNGRITPEKDNFTFLSTRGRSVVDYFLTPHDCIKFCKDFTVHTMSELLLEFDLYSLLSNVCKSPDHSMLSLQFYCTYARLDHTENTMQGPQNEQRKKFYCFDKKPGGFLQSETWRKAILDIIDHLEHLHELQDDLDTTYDDLCKCIFKELDTQLGYKFAGSKMKKKLKNSKPYWSDELSVLWKEMSRAEKLFSKCKGCRQEKHNLRMLFKQKQHAFDKCLKKAVRQYNRGKIAALETACNEDPKLFWDSLKKLGPRKSKSLPLKVRIGEDVVADEKVVTEKWKSDFENLYQQAGENCTFDDRFLEDIVTAKDRLERDMLDNNYVSNDAINGIISIDEVQKVVVKLKNKKATGYDAVPNEVIKCEEIRLLLCRLFNACFHNSIVPSVWGKAIIKPIPKGSDKDPYLPLNYRGISLISCISKVYSAVLNNRIVGYCNQLDIFADEQNGFRSNRSCEDHIFSLSCIIKNRLNNNKPTFCSFVDLEKAFDWINRDMLLYKLLSNNIDGKMYFALKSLLSNTYACVQLSNTIQTAWFSNDYGVRQGDNISPTMFSLFINDLVSYLKEKCPVLHLGDAALNCLLYADDMVLIAENEQDLQLMLDELYNWCSQWRLKVNETKTKVVHFRKPNIPMTEHDFEYGENVLEKVACYKYLGIILDENLKYDLCSSTLADSGGRALGAIISKFKALKNVGFRTFETMYNSGVKPVLEYGSGVWGHITGTCIDNVQNRAMRYYLGVHKFSPNLALSGDMGWLTPKLSRYICRVRLWNRLVAMEENRLTKKIFEWDYGIGKRNWCRQMKSLFEELQVDVYRNKDVCDLDSLGLKLKGIMLNTWKSQVVKKPKLRTYIKFKENVDTEVYVKYLTCRSTRSLFAQFRHGILPLRIETGRFRHLKVEERICELCQLSLVEDELHFLCTCPRYANLRHSMYEKAAELNPNFVNLDIERKFVSLIENSWKDVSIFIVSAWKARQNVLYK